MLDASVIIVNWNSKAYLLKCLESIKRNTHGTAIELIVVDNASGDGAGDELQRYHPDVKLIENPDNVGFAKGNNIGIAAASGRYVCLVNPDVEFLDDCLGKLCRYMDTDREAGLCGPKILNEDGTIQYSCREYPTLWNNLCFALGLHRAFPQSKAFSNELMSYFDHNTLKEVDAISGCFMVARREAVEQVGLLDEGFFMYSEDLDWCRRFHEKNWKVMFNPVAKAIHYGGGSSENAPARFAVEQERAILRYWTKYHGAFKTMLVRIILFFKHSVRLVPSAASYLLRLGDRRLSADRVHRESACLRNVLGMP